MEIPIEQKSLIANLLKKEGDRILEPTSTPIKNIYMDIEFIQDFKIGALLKMISTEVEYQYILSKLTDYSVMYRKKISEVFPDLGFTEEQILNCIRLVKNCEELAMTSPFYTNLEEVAYMFRIFTERNVLLKHMAPINIYIGSNSMIYPIVARERLVHLLSSELNNLILNFIPTSLYEFKDIPLNGYDAYLVEKASVLINHKDLVKQFEDMDMINKIVVGLVEMDTTEDELKQASTTEEQAIEATIEFSNMFTNFSFAGKTIMTQA